MTQKSPTRGGRRARLAQRAAPPKVNPAPPGARGGQYKPLSDTEVVQIIDAAMELLERLGMGDVPERLTSDLIACGAEARGGRVHFPRALTQEAIAKACKGFTFHGRDPARSIDLGGDKVWFGTGGAAVQTLDMDTGLYRAATLQDLRDFTRLQDTLDNVAWFTRCCIATDIEDVELQEINIAHALLANTTKPTAMSFTTGKIVETILPMLDIAAGGPGEFAKRPFMKAHISPVISPMRYGEDAVEVTYACLAAGMPVSCITAAQAGATAPAPLASFLVQSLAETLGSLLMVHAIAPGHPMIFSNWPFVVDLRTGAFSGGSGETAVLNAASAQIINHLGLISGVAASMTDAKAIDAQYGQEKAMTSLAAALGGGNLIYESSGMTAALLGASFEGFILDDEMHTANYRALRGIEVNDETLNLEDICQAILGDGHFLGAPQTHAVMERDYVYPELADRDDPRTWAEKGAEDAWSRAKTKARKILSEHHPNYLSEQQDAAIRHHFDICS